VLKTVLSSQNKSRKKKCEGYKTTEATEQQYEPEISVRNSQTPGLLQLISQIKIYEI
jgi:hypothetical protein